MMDPNLVIDDSYVHNISRFQCSVARSMDVCVKSYLDILETVKKEAIMDGRISAALDAYILVASKLKDQLTEIAKSEETLCDSFLYEIDLADEFLF